MDRSIQELTWEHDVIIDSSSDGLFVCGGVGRILRVNPASQRINNATAEQLVGRAYLDAAEEGLVILPSAALEASRRGPIHDPRSCACVSLPSQQLRRRRVDRLVACARRPGVPSDVSAPRHAEVRGIRQPRRGGAGR